MKCKCRDPKCRTTFYIDPICKTLIMETRRKSILVYLDVDSINEMMGKLNECLQIKEDEKCVE